MPGLLCSGWQKCDKIDPDELLSVMASSMTKSVECRKSVLKVSNVMPTKNRPETHPTVSNHVERIHVWLDQSFNLHNFSILTSQMIRAHSIKIFNSTNLPYKIGH